jgi:hypothetical protein
MSALGQKKADICAAKTHVRFTPNSDRKSGFPQMVMPALPPKADMRSALAYVCFGPIADIALVTPCTITRPPTEAGSNLKEVLQQLFLAVFFHVGFSSFFGVISSVKRVTPGGVCMMPRFFMPSAFMMFGCFTVMMRGMRMMFGGLLMMLACFF